MTRTTIQTLTRHAFFTPSTFSIIVLIGTGSPEMIEDEVDCGSLSLELKVILVGAMIA
jgi:hypothetical protein